MDLWVVAAAAGAGYVVKAKCLKKSSPRLRGGTSWESFSSESFHGQSHSRKKQTCPFCRLGFCKHSGTDGSSSSGRDVVGFASSGAAKGEVQLQSPWLDGRGDIYSISSEFLPESVVEVDSFPILTAARQLGNRSDWYIIEPHEPFGSRVAPELYGERKRSEECYIFNISSESLPESVKAEVDSFRRLTAARQVGNWSDWHVVEPCDSLGRRVDPERYGEHKRFEEYRDFRQEMQLEEENGRSDSDEMAATGELFYLEGSSKAMLLFFLGMNVGIMSAVAANGREMDYLKEKLQQKENLVQDLHEELQMEDLLTVKELVTEDSNCQGTTDQDSFCNGREPDDEKVENSEAMSKIEAELQAELERLELNMKSSSSARIFDFVAMDCNFELDAQENRVPNHGDDKPDHLSESDHNASEASTEPIYTGNYAVSAKELSLRLHEVIQSRLTARIMELEAALENSQKRLHVLESDRTIPGMAFPNEVESSSTQQTLVLMELEARIMELEAALENSQKRLHVLESDRTIPGMAFPNEVESSSTQQTLVLIGEGSNMHGPFATSDKVDEEHRSKV